MIKNLIYATLGVGGVAVAATAFVLATANNEPKECKVTLDANGGMFLPGTSTVQHVQVAYSNAIGQAFNTYAITNINYDLVGWAATKDGTDLITNTTPVVSDMRCFAKWQRSAIQQFNVTNCFFEGEVVQFPAVFYGTATRVDKTNQIIRFRSPTNGSFRISFDPQPGSVRVMATVTISHVEDSETIIKRSEFNNPLNFEKQICEFKKGVDYQIEIVASLYDVSKYDTSSWKSSGSAVYYADYALGIDLGSSQVHFDLNQGEYNYGTLKNARFGVDSDGANLTTNYPFGYLPGVNEKESQFVSFSGWYTEKSGGTKLAATDLVGTNTIYYAHWKLPAFNYYVDFDGNSSEAEGLMDRQTFTSDKYQTLTYNRFYRSGWKFVGWATTSNGKKKYNDGESVVNLCETPKGICTLFAVWRETPGTNSYTVSQYVKEFKNVPIASNTVTQISGSGSDLTFTMTMTNAANVRVSLDPRTDSNRIGARLAIERKLSGNSWSNVCNVTDLSTNATNYAFEKDATYRFTVTGAGVTSSYGYIVGLGAQGARIDFDPCGKEYVNASTLSSSLTFDWTVDTPFGYVPNLTSSKYGNLLGWYRTKDITVTNDQVTSTSVINGSETVYAHWANQPYYVAFNGSGATMPTNSYVQNFYYNKAQALSRNQYYWNEYRFMGWTTNKAAKCVYKGGETPVYDYADGAVVSNLCSIAGGTNTLYAVWQHTPGTNWYYVTGGVTNFGSIAVSQGSPTLFVGKGDTTQFYAVSANISNCRVAIDPDLGYGRTGAKLTVDSAEIPTNKNEKLEWESACTVTDLSEKEVKCAFTTNRCYRFTISGVANTNGYVVSIGAEGARYIFDVCGGNFVGVEKPETTKVRFYNWTVGSAIAYTPPVTTNAYVHGTNTWHYTPLYLPPAQEREQGIKSFSVTNLIVSGGEKLYAHWSNAVIVDLVFDWNIAATNVVFTNYYGQGATVKLYDDAYVRQPTYDNRGFLGWTTNRTGIAGYDLTSFTATTNSAKFYYAQWTDEWKTSRTSDGAGLSIDGYYGTLGATLNIPKRVNAVGGIEWPVNVVAIGELAFENCTFTTLELPSTLTRIGSAAFSGCSAFKVLNIPEGVTYLGDSAFDGCTSLTTVRFPTVDVENEYAESGFLDGVLNPDSPSVELCTCLFKGCTSLKDVELPLGVNCIPDECFSGCTAMTSFDKMPYTVAKIGSEAFAGCTHLVTNVVTEAVDEIGDGAFLKCARLRQVRFLGDQPGDVSGDIFKGTQRNVLVGYLQNMCVSATEYCGGTWPELPGTWPSGSYSRTLTWLGGKYPRRKVIFNFSDNKVLWKSTQVPALYHSRRVFGLLAPTKEEMDGGSSVKASNDDEEEEEEEEKTGFSGWYTQPIGGRKIGNYWVVPTASEGDSAPITVYAHWGEEKEAGETEIGSRSSEEYPVSWPGSEGSENTFEDFTGFYSADDDMFYYSASTFNGIVVDTDADNSAITGTVVFAFQDATYPADGGMQSAFTATITWNGGRTTSISGVADAEGYLRASGKRWSFGEGDDGTLITKSGIYGWLTDNNEGITFRVYAARNRTAQATEGAARTVVLTGLQATKGTWHVVLKSSAGESEFSNGYSTFAITISGMGQAIIEGTLADGTKVSTSSTLIIGDGCCCLPVSIRPYGGKGGMAFMLWFAWRADGSFSEEEDDVSVQGLSAWTAPTFTVPITDIEIYPLTFIDAKRYEGDASFECDCIAPVKITAYDKGTKWKIATGAENPDNLKVSYNAATGLFTGSFAVENSETGKKSTATVNGAFTDSITAEGDIYHGYGTAVIKNEGSVPVEIETETLP